MDGNQQSSITQLDLLSKQGVVHIIQSHSLFHVVVVSQVAAALAIALLRAQFARARVGAVARGTVAVDALPMHAQDQGQGAATTATSQVSA